MKKVTITQENFDTLVQSIVSLNNKVFDLTKKMEEMNQKIDGGNNNKNRVTEDPFKNNYKDSCNKKEKNTCNVKRPNLTIAREVLEGKWGNGANRKKRLCDAGYDYDEIQKIVNEIIHGRDFVKENNEDVKYDTTVVFKNVQEDQYELFKDTFNKLHIIGVMGKSIENGKKNMRLKIKYENLSTVLEVLVALSETYDIKVKTVTEDKVIEANYVCM